MSGSIVDICGGTTTGPSPCRKLRSAGRRWPDFYPSYPGARGRRWPWRLANNFLTYSVIDYFFKKKWTGQNEDHDGSEDGSDPEEEDLVEPEPSTSMSDQIKETNWDPDTQYNSSSSVCWSLGRISFTLERPPKSFQSSDQASVCLPTFTLMDDGAWQYQQDKLFWFLAPGGTWN